MRRPPWGWYPMALAVLVVGLVWVGVPASTLLVAGLVLVCPLMMLFMMRGMNHGGQSSEHKHGDERPDHQHADRNHAGR